MFPLNPLLQLTPLRTQRGVARLAEMIWRDPRPLRVEVTAGRPDHVPPAAAKKMPLRAVRDGESWGRLYDQRWGLDESCGYDDAFAVDQALDNPGSPRDMAELLAMVAESRCASAPSCRLMIEIMSRQEWREKIPAGLPPGLLVANKTGGVSGTSNDAAIVYTPSGAPLVMVVYCKGLGSGAKARASQAIADIAAELYEHLGEPA